MEGSTITIARWELYAMIAAIVLGPLIVNEAWRAATPSAASAQVVSVVRGIFAPWSRLARPWYRAGGMHVTPLISVGTIVVPALLFGGAVRAAGIHFFALWLAFGVALIASSLRGWDKEFYVGFILPLYVMVIFAAPALVPAGHVASLAALLVAGVAGMLVKIGVCMSIGLHRYAAHAAFKCGPVVRFGLSVLGCLANQGGPIWWASQHRAHHKFCDGERDPHSAEQVGVVKAFVFFDRITNVNEEFAPRHLESLSIRVLDTFAGACVAVEFYLAHRFGGLPALWVAYVSAVLCQTVTLWFNIVNHPPRQPGAPDKCDASDHTNSALVEPPTPVFKFLNLFLWCTDLVGEETHLHHHEHPAASHRPVNKGVDFPYYAIIWPLKKAGLLTRLKD